MSLTRNIIWKIDNMLYLKQNDSLTYWLRHDSQGKSDKVSHQIILKPTLWTVDVKRLFNRCHFLLQINTQFAVLPSSLLRQTNVFYGKAIYFETFLPKES